MYLLKTTLVVFCALLLLACKHPLAIVGQGDIIDLNNSGRGCSLEQYQQQDSVCTENTVSEEYHVNYLAQPRPGWRFVKWEGPCSRESDFQHCRIDSEADWVAWMFENYPDYEFPPSTAIFEPITGQVGYLADAAVAGVAYESTSYQGFTNLDGSFQYADGETVRFKIGDTALGEVPGQAQVTPFDLAGSAVITGTPSIKRALDKDEDPFHTVINLSVFLQTLDHDANPENGINIRRAVARLFKDVNLGLSQDWEAFRDQFILRQALARANKMGLFSEAHWIARPEHALEHLYESLQVDARILAVSQADTDDGGDGVADVTESREYDADGRLLQMTTLTYHSDSDEVSRGVYTYEFDAPGNLVRLERDSYLAGWMGGSATEIILETYVYDAFGNLTSLEEESTVQLVDGELEDLLFSGKSFERWQYDPNGSLILHERDGDERNLEFSENWQYDTRGRIVQYEQFEHWNVSPELVTVWQYQYDNDGRLVYVSYDANPGLDDYVVGDGVPLSTTAYQYDLEGKLLRVELNGGDLALTAAALGIADIPNLGLAQTYSITYQYDIDGTLVGETRDGAHSTYGRYVASWLYNAKGDVIRNEDRLERYNIDQPDEVSISEFDYQYDEFGNLVRQRNHDISNGTLEVNSWRYTYDEHGNITSREFDEFSDGYLEEHSVWRFDSQDYLIWRQTNEDGDLATTTLQHTAAGWGYIFVPSEPDLIVEGFFPF